VLTAGRIGSLGASDFGGGALVYGAIGSCPMAGSALEAHSRDPNRIVGRIPDGEIWFF